MDMLTQLTQRLATGLDRKSIANPSTWAEKYRVMGAPFPGPWSFKHHPWLREMHDSKAEFNIGQKSAQMGYSETGLNLAFYSIDILNHDVLYVLPNKTPDASDFSAARFDAALVLSDHLSTLFSDVKNVGHKRAGSTNLYIRGSQSRVGLKSIATPKVFIDEIDECNQDNIPLALERMSGQPPEFRLLWMISTPTIDKYGVNKYYLDSSQEHYHFKCPHCSKLTELIFPDCLVITAEEVNDDRVKDTHLVCKECKATLSHETKSEWLSNGQWVEGCTQRESRGFHINQLYSTTITPKDLAIAFLKSRKDPAQEQEFYNSKLGIPHIVEGARVTDKHILDCMAGHRKQEGCNGNHFITMGVDVGKKLHIEITQWDLSKAVPIDICAGAIGYTIWEGTVDDFDRLDYMMVQYSVRFCVIDANPEKRMAEAFAKRFPGRVLLCYYGNNIRGRDFNLNPAEISVTVDRTAWLDQSLGRFKNKTIKLPIDVSLEYREHIKAQVRVYKKDKDGNPTAYYVTGSQEDHFGHARNYNEIALPLAAGVGANQDIVTAP